MTIAPDALLADDWIARRRAAIDPARASEPVPIPAPTAAPIYLCAADRDGLLVSLIQSNFFGAGCGPAGRRVGDQPPQPRLVVQPRCDGHPNVLGPRQDADAHAHPGDRVARRPAVARVRERWAGTGRRRRTSRCSRAMLVDGDDPQAAISAPRCTIDPDHWPSQVEDRFDAGVDRRPARARTRRSDVVPRLRRRHGPSRTRSRCWSRATAVATDPRAEGAAAGL